MGQGTPPFLRLRGKREFPFSLIPGDSPTPLELPRAIPRGFAAVLATPVDLRLLLLLLMVAADGKA